MEARQRTALIGLVLGIGLFGHPAEGDDKQPFALVELFTSEGCSSCPPADELLGEIAAGAQKGRRRIFPLGFHVDYWDYLGWKDSFSNPAYTQRQHVYADALRASSLYTPQMIVNGFEGFVGSDRRRALGVIEKALTRPAQVAVSLRVSTAQDSNSYAIEYGVTPVPVGAVLNVALVQGGLVTKVTSGENAGRTLRHENVVRLFRTVSLGPDGKGTVQFERPSSMKEGGQAIVYVQDPRTMEILGASASEAEEVPSQTSIPGVQ